MPAEWRQLILPALFNVSCGSLLLEMTLPLDYVQYCVSPCRLLGGRIAIPNNVKAIVNYLRLHTAQFRS